LEVECSFLADSEGPTTPSLFAHSHLSLLGHLWRIVHFDYKIPNSAFKLGVTE
jgi:hypothetical protein